MPKIDPVTGCEVMTFFEFLGEEGKRENKEPADILDKIYQEMAEANANEEEMMSRPENAFDLIKEYSDFFYEDWRECAMYDFENGNETEPQPPRIKELLEVLDVKHDGGFSGCKTFLLARVKGADHVDRIVEYHYEYWSGTRMEPPEEDGELIWHDSVEEYHTSVAEKKRKEAERKRIIG